MVPADVAEIITDGVADNVLTVKVALVAPAGMVTVGGTVAAAVLLLDRVTITPPAGAGPFSCTVPVTEVPCFTLVELNESA